MPIHLRAEPGDYAPAVLCPGDPRRAQFIAEAFFEGPRLVNEERGMLGFTGTFEGRPISVQASGMGCPSAAIVYEELAQLGAKRLIRVGTCGALQPSMAFADAVIALAATPDDKTVFTYTGGDQHAPVASWELVDRAVDLAREQGLTAHVGPIVSSDVFYDPDTTRLARWASRGHLAVEMESSVLYLIAALRGMRAVTLLTVSDLISGDDAVRIGDDELREGVRRVTELACRLAVADL